MASAGGLTRRRGGGGATTEGADDNDTSRVSSPAPKNSDKTPETSYTGGENGHKIAFDPRDISESEERNKQPKLTLMEDVLLLGLKDKQVCSSTAIARQCHAEVNGYEGLSFVLERQYLLRFTRMHSHRARFPRSREHAEGLVEAAFPIVGPGYRGY